MGRAFTNGSEDRRAIPGGVISKTQKMVLDAALHYKVQIKPFRERSKTVRYSSV